MTDVLLARRRAPVLQVVKSAVATVAAWFAASLLIPGPPPVFAAIAALLVVQPSLNQSLAKAVERTVGVVAGVVIASILGLVLGEASWVVVVATVAGAADGVVDVVSVCGQERLRVTLARLIATSIACGADAVGIAQVGARLLAPNRDDVVDLQPASRAPCTDGCSARLLSASASRAVAVTRRPAEPSASPDEGAGVVAGTLWFR